uniref:Uncharacterized protein n=1 Tax=Rousettus aegyptiacus TaxID=9407 RepID=A0A7J8KBE4_ROUAE|nr:hypothetical protein HJG63_007967 [Rousettus aegyptiacus]
MFSSIHFIVSSLIFRSLIHSELFLVCGDRQQSSFILLQVAFQFSQHHLWKRISFLHCMFLSILSKIICPCKYGLTSRLLILFLWSVCLFSCQCHAVLITVILKYDLKLDRVMPPALFFFVRMALVIWGLLCFHTNMMIFLFYFFKKC